MNLSATPYDTDIEISMPIPQSVDEDAGRETPAKPQVVEIFRLLSDITRWTILRYLHGGGERDVTSICEHIQQSQPGISHHLSLMKRAGILRIRRSGKHNFYSLNPGTGAGRFVKELLGRFNRPTPPQHDEQP